MKETHDEYNIKISNEVQDSTLHFMVFLSSTHPGSNKISSVKTASQPMGCSLPIFKITLKYFSQLLSFFGVCWNFAPETITSSPHHDSNLGSE